MNTSISTMCRFPRLATCTVVGLLSGCGEELLTLNYIEMPTNRHFIAQVAAGQSSVTDVFGRATCTLTVNTSVTDITTHKNGDLGQVGYNIAISTAGPLNAVTTNPESCPDIMDLQIRIGSLGELLDIGSATNSIDLNATVEGARFTSSPSGYFAATISGQNQTAGTVSGTFEAISTNANSASPMMIVTRGSFNVH